MMMRNFRACFKGKRAQRAFVNRTSSYQMFFCTDLDVAFALRRSLARSVCGNSLKLSPKWQVLNAVFWTQNTEKQRQTDREGYVLITLNGCQCVSALSRSQWATLTLSSITVSVSMQNTSSISWLFSSPHVLYSWYHNAISSKRGRAENESGFYHVI